MNESNGRGSGAGMLVILLVIGLLVVLVGGGAVFYLRAGAELQVATRAEFAARMAMENAIREAGPAQAEPTDRAAGPPASSTGSQPALHLPEGVLFQDEHAWLFVAPTDTDEPGTAQTITAGFDRAAPRVEAGLLVRNIAGQEHRLLCTSEDSLRIWRTDGEVIRRFSLPPSALQGIVRRLEREQPSLRELLLQWTGCASVEALVAPPESPR